MLEHSFNGPPFTIGIEEELMLIDAESLDLAQEVEAILAAVPEDIPGYVKPELMQSVLEVATKPCEDVASAGEQLRALRLEVARIAEERGVLIGAAGTHPFARWEDQKIVERPRYQQLVEELGYVARQELIFGTHVHVAIEGPDKAIYVADGVRRYLPLLLALSSNSPFWRGYDTGMMSARTPVFRAFPRNGIPPHYGTWEIYSRRVELMMESGAIEDYTYLWWDVRPHPRLGTVETRVFDQQTRLDATLALTALTAALAHRLSSLFDREEPMVEYPSELIDDNKVRAAVRGIEGELIDFREGRQVPAREMVRRMLDELAEHAQELGCEAELAGVDDLVENGTGARRQLGMHARNGNLTELAREIADHTRP
ncbi:MAG TPA: carboxylate-amine ligase [Solirubrobacterales bacterium]|nr:carboxylate-amine ligase [Solirubrobacterales bacterium]